MKLQYTANEILHEDQRRKLIGIADYIYSLQQMKKKSKTVLQDIKIIIPSGFLNQITGLTEIEEILKGHHTPTYSPDNLKFVLRRTSPTNGCLP